MRRSPRVSESPGDRHHFHRLILPRREDQRGATGEGQTIGLAPGAPGEFKGYPTKMLVNGECYRMISNDYIMNGLKATKIYLNGFTGILKSTMKYESRWRVIRAGRKLTPSASLNCQMKKQKWRLKMVEAREIWIVSKSTKNVGSMLMGRFPFDSWSNCWHPWFRYNLLT